VTEQELTRMWDDIRLFLIGVLGGLLLATFISCGPSPKPQPPQPVPTPNPVPLPAPEPPPLPDPPTRDQVTHSHLTFQGLTVTCDGYGAIPWFEIAISSVDAACRQQVYAAKRAAGDTALGIAVSWNYSNDAGYSYPVVGRDFTDDYPALHALVEEVIRAGFTPWIFLAGDGQSKPDCTYNDPHGWTYGYTCLSQGIFPATVRALDSLNAYVLYVPGFDAVFYGWDPLQVQRFGQQFRSLLPNGYLAIEHNQGHIPLGKGDADYAPNGPMQAYDVILGEYNNWPATGDVVWQILARMLGPAYRRGPDQPASDDPGAPFSATAGQFYLRYHTPRGPYVYHCFEYGLYDWVRQRISLSDLQKARNYYVQRGCAVVE